MEGIIEFTSNAVTKQLSNFYLCKWTAPIEAGFFTSPIKYPHFSFPSITSLTDWVHYLEKKNPSTFPSLVGKININSSRTHEGDGHCFTIVWLGIHWPLTIIDSFCHQIELRLCSETMKIQEIEKKEKFSLLSHLIIRPMSSFNSTREELRRKHNNPKPTE